MILQHATWRDVEDYLKRSTGIVVPIGSTEQHGPGGAIGTDAICAEAIAHRLAAEDDVLVGPTIALGAAQFNLAFPGTVSLRASTLMAVVSDYVKSLAAQGFTRFYFLNGHGANIAPCNAAFHDLHGEASLARGGAMPAIRCRLRSWWEYEAANALRQQLYGAAEGMHATPSEIAIALAAVPATRHPLDAPAPERLDPSVLRDIGGDRHYDAHHHRRRYPDGRIGSDSSLANAEDGARLLTAAVAGARADYARFMTEP